MFDRAVRFSARMTPLAIAASNGAEHVNYRDFDRAIDQAAAALDAAGVGGTALAAISIADSYRHLLLVLACARLGVATVSLMPEMARPMMALTRASLLLSDNPALAPDLVTDAEWLAAALAAATAAVAPAALDPQALGRVQLSSGSTGEPKAVGMSWALMERRIEHHWTRNYGGERVLSLVGPESGALPLFLWCWARGGCVLFGSPDPATLARSLPILQPTGLLASPVQIAAVLDALPAQATPLPGLYVSIAGARAARTLRQRVALRLGTVNIAYASTEAGVCTSGFAASLDSNEAVGWVTPWTEIEIVDDEGRRVADGTSGRIRVRGGDVIDRYLGQAGEADDRFRDGWFYSGDLGALEGGLLSVHGRTDEVMNFGGQKFLPHVLETPVRAIAGVADVAAFALDDENGIAQPWLAVVRDGEIAEGAIGAALRIEDLPPVRIAWIDALPVTPLGKIRREILRDAARDLMQASGG